MICPWTKKTCVSASENSVVETTWLTHFAVHAERDEILFDDARISHSRSLQDYDDRDEVFALNGLDEDPYDQSEDAAETDEEEVEEDKPSKISNSRRTSKTKPMAKPSSKGQAQEESSADESEEDEERWGKNKSAYYSSATQEIESDDEEAQALEQAEARRLHAKSREYVAEDDYGVADIMKPVSLPPQRPFV